MSRFLRLGSAPLVVASLLTPWLAGCIVQQPARVVYEPAPQPVPYQQAAPSPPPAYNPPPAYAPPPSSEQNYDDSPPAYGPDDDAVAVRAPEPPPPLPDYDQPPCPEEGYIWTPGYWHWSPGGYYWVPGTWVQPPQVGLLWTPGFWAFSTGVYIWHAGYWGPHVGYYGGVNYGYGYGGFGFEGGRWEGNHFAYNRAVNNVNTTVIHNTYNTTVVNNVTINKVSYNGGPGGVAAQPSPQERMYSHESHVPPTPVQTTHVTEARNNPALFAHANNGKPAIAATVRPAAFTGGGVVSAHGATSSPLIQNFNRPAGGNPVTPQPPPQPAGGAAAQGPQPAQLNTGRPGAPSYQPNVARPPGAGGPPAYAGRPPAVGAPPTQFNPRPPVNATPPANAAPQAQFARPPAGNPNAVRPPSQSPIQNYQPKSGGNPAPAPRNNNNKPHENEGRDRDR